SLHPEAFYIGVRPESWSVQAGGEIGFGVQTVDWERNIFSNQTLTASFQKVNWELDRSAFQGIGYPQYRLSFTDISSASFETNENGQARMVFIPPEPGTYLLEVRHGGAVTQVMSWVGGQGSVAWPNLPNQQLPLTAEKDAYRPNETALIFIPNPFEGDALALVTVERSQVMRKYVFSITGSNYEFPLSLTDEDAPNVYVSVTLLGYNTEGRPDFRLGYLELEVEPEAQTLNVSMEAVPQRSGPGEQVVFSIQVSDYQDNPVQGEFSLALVDKAVLALAEPNAPEILEAFFGLQPFGIRNSFSLAAYAMRILAISADGLGGGGGGPEEAPFVRDDFKDTAFWSGTIETDRDGRAEVQVQLPDNLTTWVAKLRGLTKDTMVGETESELITTKELLIRPEVPRFLVEGDHVELTAIVHNNTDQKINAEVSLQALGFILDNDDDILQRVDIPASSQVRVAWWGTVQTGGDVELIFLAEAGDLQDAARPERGDLPVLSYTYPQTFGTSGVLTEGGDWLEVISLPRTFEPAGGELRLEMAPSLAAAILDGLEALEIFPTSFTEPLLSRLLPNIETYRLLQDLGLDSPALESDLSEAVISGVESLSKNQNKDGGWGWIPGIESDIHITSYVLFGLSRASSAGVFIEPEVLANAQDYLLSQLISPVSISQPWQFDQLVFQHFALLNSGISDLNTEALYEIRDQLNPWAKSLLALILFESDTTRDLSLNLLDELNGAASRTATGAHWEDTYPSWRNLTSSNANTAIVLYVLAQIDPASPLLSEVVRYIVLHRQPHGGWTSSYETAWVLMGLTETMKGRGELQADYSFSASLNAEILISGQADGAGALTSVSTSISISELFQESPNALRVSREEGEGSLYYRAFLQVDQPVDLVLPVDRGLSMTKRYDIQGLDCGESGCEPVTSVSISDLEAPLLVRLALTIPEEMHYLVVEDWIPAGAEILDTSLKTSQLGYPLDEPSDDSFDPFSSDWSRWLFGSPQIFDDHIRWIARWVPAGTFELTYQIVPFQAGEFQVIPAHAYQYYFPEVEGSSAGTVLGISP
ncbi:MAG: hypothetical protein MUO76_12170, partial [Anaerolineaceae bacterium]|nr:hypothetical protein [Anaerolineaceae bacterium]